MLTGFENGLEAVSPQGLVREINRDLSRLRCRCRSRLGGAPVVQIAFIGAPLANETTAKTTVKKDASP